VFDPRSQGEQVGKAKRIRAVLISAAEREDASGSALIHGLMALLRACGGFRSGAPNYVGEAVITDAKGVFRSEGYELTTDGELHPLLLDGFAGADLTGALRSYVRRAQRGAADAALVTATGKDLVEATAAHILNSRFGCYPEISNFPTLLGQAFAALGLATPAHAPEAGEAACRRMERALFELACAVNALRNKEGTGHGRPWLPTVSATEARAAIGAMGVVAEYLLAIDRDK
jgi:hypothetical protein